jgi:protein TonB
MYLAVSGSDATGAGSGWAPGRGLGAAGGGAGAAGTGPGAAGAGPGPGAGATARARDPAEVVAEIRRRIEAAKRYPDSARRDGVHGTVAVRFRVTSDGQVERVEVVRSSGSRALDEASLETIRKAAPFPPVGGWVQVPIAYTLSETER